jgi:hypothetical protein
MDDVSAHLRKSEATDSFISAPLSESLNKRG